MNTNNAGTFTRGTNAGTVRCNFCGTLRQAANVDRSTGLCVKCYDQAGDENFCVDNHDIDSAQCAYCTPTPTTATLTEEIAPVTTTPATKSCTTSGCTEPRFRPTALKCTAHEAEYKAAAKARKEAAAASAPLTVEAINDAAKLAYPGAAKPAKAPRAAKVAKVAADPLRKAGHTPTQTMGAAPIARVAGTTASPTYTPRTMKNLGAATREQEAAKAILAECNASGAGATDPRWMPAMAIYVGPAKFAK